ncbi:hypothetical protein AVEN_252236-1 [Araneus ventricosus]|uniref:Uncharacterized protein n=1 Tax=Araneus ventricosus TaxID=182803 RepID=A0A4Y2TCP4_ARAVE|nr:hypothetical protein AVEN_252236-1 [Araneus ventricosus]
MRARQCVGSELSPDDTGHLIPKIPFADPWEAGMHHGCAPGRGMFIYESGEKKSLAFIRVTTFSSGTCRLGIWSERASSLNKFASLLRLDSSRSHLLMMTHVLNESH